MKLKRKITTDSVMEELKKKFNRPDLTNEGLLDWLTGGSKPAAAPAKSEPSGEDLYKAPGSQANNPAPNPDANANITKGPPDKPPEAPTTASGPTPNAGRGGFGRLSAAMVGPTKTDMDAGPADASKTPGAIAIEKPGDIAKTDVSTAKGIGGTDSKIPDDVKQAKAAEIASNDKAAGMTPKDVPPATPPGAGAGRGSAEFAEKPGEREKATAANFKFNSSGGKVSADELAKYREHVGNANATLGQYMNARDKKTAITGGANDPDVIQKKIDPSGGGRTQAYRPGSGTTSGKLKENLEQFVRSQYIAEAKKEEMEEAIDNADPGLGARYNPKKTVFKMELQKGSRNWGGNQKRTPSTYAEEATKMVKKKVMEKKKEQPLGSTSTGKNGETITIQPTKPELTGYH